MGDHALIYSYVARGTTILAEYTSYTGNFNTIAIQCLSKLPPSKPMHTYVYDHHTFNFLVADNHTYLAVADEDFGRQVPFSFLERVKDDFQQRYQGGRADLATAGSLNAEFAPRLQSLMEYVVEHPDEIQKASRIKSQVAEVKNIMMVNIEKVLDRDEKIASLVGKTTYLETGTRLYQEQSNQLRRRNWWRNCRIKLFVLVLIVIIAMIIYLSVCKGFVCK